MRTTIAYLILAAMVVVALGALAWFRHTSRAAKDKRRIRREDDAWADKRARLDGEPSAGE
jgi:hypothetical protein